MSFQSYEPIHSGPSRTFRLERTAWAHVFASFHCRSRVHISEELPQDYFPGQDNAWECPHVRAFIPGATLQQHVS